MKTIQINRTELDLKLHTPIFDYCRKLIREGVDPKTKLEVWGIHDEPDITITEIGIGATLSVSETPYVHFCKYRPYPNSR